MDRRGNVIRTRLLGQLSETDRDGSRPLLASYVGGESSPARADVFAPAHNDYLQRTYDTAEGKFRLEVTKSGKSQKSLRNLSESSGDRNAASS